MIPSTPPNDRDKTVPVQDPGGPGGAHAPPQEAVSAPPPPPPPPPTKKKFFFVDYMNDIASIYGKFIIGKTHNNNCLRPR